LQPDKGRVVVLGADRGNVADDRLGYLPVERGLYKRMRVADVLTYFARLKGYRDCRAAVHDWLDRLDAGSWSQQRVDSLSKGMAQKIQFIAAVIASPELVILDEPFAGLDPVNLDVLRDAVVSLRASGSTVVLSTHDMSIAEKLCDTIFMIFEGRKVLDGSLADIQAQHPIRRLRIRMSGGGELPPDVPGVDAVASQNGFHSVQLQEDAHPQAILRQLADAGEVEHFEIVRPTLHDIFVAIAKPHAQEAVA
jgi:ABC-2 type transport system ATP-binding protein